MVVMTSTLQMTKENIIFSPITCHVASLPSLRHFSELSYTLVSFHARLASGDKMDRERRLRQVNQAASLT